MQTKLNTKPKDPRIIDKQAVPVDPNHTLKLWVWIFFFLWVFEGALRKWVVPALSQPLLVIRDPIVLWLLILCSRRGILKFNIYIAGIIVIGVVSLFTAVGMGHGNVWVAIYGARILLLYFPMIFVIGAVFTREDVIKFGKIVIYMAIPMTILLGLQFYSPQSAWVNKGIGSDETGSGFSGALGYFRAACTFSFSTGTVCFYSIVAPFIIYFWLTPIKIKRYLLIAATGALIIAIPLSISRGLFFQVAVSIIFLLLAISRNPKYFSKILIGSILVMLALYVLSGVSFFKTATEAFSSRFEGANEAEGGIVEGVIGDRFFGMLFKAVVGAPDQPLFGFGIGSGTPLGLLLLKDDRISKTADFEWMREVGELGLIALLVISIRVGLAVKMGLASYRKLGRGDTLPWLLMSVGVLAVSIGAWHQPTSLGYFSLMGGLWLASLKKAGNKIEKNKAILIRKDLVGSGSNQKKMG